VTKVQVFIFDKLHFIFRQFPQHGAATDIFYYIYRFIQKVLNFEVWSVLFMWNN